MCYPHILFYPQNRVVIKMLLFSHFYKLGYSGLEEFSNFLSAQSYSRGRAEVFNTSNTSVWFYHRKLHYSFHKYSWKETFFSPFHIPIKYVSYFICETSWRTTKYEELRKLWTFMTDILNIIPKSLISNSGVFKKPYRLFVRCGPGSLQFN